MVFIDPLRGAKTNSLGNLINLATKQQESLSLKTKSTPLKCPAKAKKTQHTQEEDDDDSSDGEGYIPAASRKGNLKLYRHFSCK